MQRRHFLRMAAAGAASSALLPAAGAQAATVPVERAFMAGLLQKMAEPVLSNMARASCRSTSRSS